MKGKNPIGAKKIISKALLCIFVIFAVIIVTAAFVLHDRITTLLSVKSFGGDLCTVDYIQDYYLDKALCAEIDSDEKMFKFVSDNLLFGHELNNNSKNFACSAFVTPDTNGQYLLGRNFDSPEMDTISVYTHPKDGYAAIASSSDNLLGMGSGAEIQNESFFGKAALLAAPYFCVDGVNEKGLSVSALNLDMFETHEDNGKPDLTLTLAIRLLLDRAANVDEAVELLDQYDFHSHHGWTQHLFIADSSGKSIVVEWIKGEMNTAESNICANFELTSKSSLEDPTGNCPRFDYLYNTLNKKPENTVNDVFGLLESVNQDFTQWSVVYDLSEFKAEYSIDCDYENIYSLSPNDY